MAQPGLVEPIMGKVRIEQLFEAARTLGAPGSMQRIGALLEGSR